MTQTTTESIVSSWKLLGSHHTEMLPAFVKWAKDPLLTPELKSAVWRHPLVQESVHHNTAWFVRMPYYLSAPYFHREHDFQKRTVVNAWPIIADMCTPEELDELIRTENMAAKLDNDD